MTPLAISGLLLGCVVATAFGYFLTAMIIPIQFRQPFAWVLAPGIGLGFCSLVFFIFRRPVFTVEAVLLITIGAVWFRRQSWTGITKNLDLSWRPPLFALAVASVLTFATAIVFSEVDVMPHGDVDGWAIWNAHARVLHRAGNDWKSILPYTFHADYPLFTSSVAARFWRYAGREIPEAGALLGILLCLSCAGMLGLTLRQLRDSRLSMVFPIVLVATPYYLNLAGDQFADVPVSFFILATIALLVLHLERRPSESGLLAIAGFTAGLAAWTKNEGLLFAAITGLSVFVIALFSRSDLRRHFLPFVLGAVPPLLVILVFKFSLARPNDLIESSNYQTLQGFLSPDRHLAILKYGVGMLWSFGAWTVNPLIPLFAFVGLRGIDRNMLRSTGWLTGAIVLGGMIAGYYAVYLVTPLDLQYHLQSSMDRLIAQLWPSFLLLLGLAARPV